jgi:hypothetical protein
MGASTFDVSSACAEKTTEELIKECGGLDLEKFGITDEASALCVGYISGVISSMTMKPLKRKLCWFDIPADTPLTDFPIILMRYLNANPAAITMAPPQPIYAAMREAYPCGQAMNR